MGGEARVLGGVTVWVCAEAGAPLGREVSEVIGEAFGAGARVVAIPVARLDPGFLDLSTRIAGEALQRFVNYGFVAAIVGDLGEALGRSGALADFVRESNRGRHVWFVADLDELAVRLAAPTRPLGGRRGAD